LSEIRFCRKCQFKASHFYWIPGLGEEENIRKFGEYINEHDHDWEVTLWLAGEINPQTGMVGDLIEVDLVIQEKIINVFHRSNINRAHPYFKEHLPTTEQMAVFFSRELKFQSVECVKIRVAESPNLFSEWIK